MKQIIFNVDELVPTLSVVSSVLSSKPIMPILSCVRIDIKHDNVLNVKYARFTTSDNEIWMQANVALEDADEDIVVCVDAKNLLQALGNLGNKQVKMDIDDESHTIKCEYTNGFFILPFSDAREYPMPKSNEESTATIQMAASKMLCAIKNTKMASANDPLRVIMNGVHFDFLSDCMVAVATNGRILSKYKDMGIKVDTTDGFTIPNKVCDVICKMIANQPQERIIMSYNEHTMKVEGNSFMVISRLIDGKYPMYERVIPHDNDKAIKFDRGEMVSAIKRVLPMSSTSSEVLVFSFADNMLTISAQDTDYGKSAQEYVTCEYMYTPCTIGFSGSLLLLLLQGIESDSISLRIKDGSHPCLITSDEEDAEAEHTQLIMPMRI